MAKKTGMGSHTPNEEVNSSRYLKEEEFRNYFEQFGEDRAQGYLDAVKHMAEEVEKILNPVGRVGTPHVVRQLLRNFHYRQHEFLNGVEYKSQSDNTPDISI